MERNEQVCESPKESKQAQGFIGQIKKSWFLFANLIYHYCYFVGLQLLRSTRGRRRRLSSRLQRAEHSSKEHIYKFFRDSKIQAQIVRRELLEPLRNLRERHKELLREAQDAKRRGQNRFLIGLRITGHLLHGLLRAIGFVLSYVAPVAAGLFFFGVVSYYNNQQLALRVEYNGEVLGYISNELEFSQAQNEVKARIVSEDYVMPDSIVPKLELTVIEPEQLTSVDTLTNRLIWASGNQFQEADGLYIQDRFVSAVTDGDALLDYMSDMLDKYYTEDMSEQTKIQFVKKVELKSGLYPISSVKPLEEVEEILSGEERGEQRYTVVTGDSPWTIAIKNGLSVEELEAMNPGVTESLLPGDSLLISQSVPFLGVQVTETIQYEEEVPYQIKQITNPDQDIGWTRVTQQGKEGVRLVTAEIKMIDGIEVERTEINREVIQQPVEQILEVGGNQPLKFIPSTSDSSLPSGTFGWPAAGGSITTGFLGYYGHTGSDITFSGCYGTPVYASMDGVVTVAKVQYYAYGIHCIIDHGGGVQTLYAHMSQMYVHPGQQVQQGELIGLIGRTGNATGPHLHFEIRINGTPVNAAPYLYG